jgi:phage shock protein PspC (stress-responsive transcriptional regulator)
VQVEAGLFEVGEMLPLLLESFKDEVPILGLRGVPNGLAEAPGIRVAVVNYLTGVVAVGKKVGSGVALGLGEGVLEGAVGGT